MAPAPDVLRPPMARRPAAVRDAETREDEDVAILPGSGVGGACVDFQLLWPGHGRCSWAHGMVGMVLMMVWAYGRQRRSQFAIATRPDPTRAVPLACYVRMIQVRMYRTRTGQHC